MQLSHSIYVGLRCVTSDQLIGRDNTAMHISRSTAEKELKLREPQFPLCFALDLGGGSNFTDVLYQQQNTAAPAYPALT